MLFDPAHQQAWLFKAVQYQTAAASQRPVNASCKIAIRPGILRTRSCCVAGSGAEHLCGDDLPQPGTRSWLSSKEMSPQYVKGPRKTFNVEKPC
jgi:hypothetical protein